MLESEESEVFLEVLEDKEVLEVGVVKDVDKADREEMVVLVVMEVTVEMVPLDLVSRCTKCQQVFK
jgi:hypothetical protein